MSFRRLLSLFLSTGQLRSVVGNNALSPYFTFSRAASGALIRSTDTVLSEFSNNIPRFDPTLGLLIEGQRTNGNRNPRGEGAATGTPGTTPTHWGIATSGSGLSRQVVGTGVENGRPYVDLRFFGTANATNGYIISFETVTGVAAASGNTFTASAFVSLIAGALPLGAAADAFAVSVHEFDSGSVFLRSTDANTPLTATPTRYRQTITTGVNCAFVRQLVFVRFNNGQVCDYTLRVSLPQIELAPFASSPILPPVGTPGTTTRLADSLSTPLSSLGIAANGACTIVGTCTLPQLALGAAQIAVEINDGTTANRIGVRNTAGTSTLVLYRITAGAYAEAPSPLTIPLNVPIRFAMSLDGAGRGAVSFNGSAVQSFTGGPTVLTTFRVGGTVGATATLNGYISRLEYLPYPVSDAMLAVQSKPDLTQMPGYRELISWP